MEQRLQPLFTPWKIGNCEIKNRVVLTSMGGTNLLGWIQFRSNKMQERWRARRGDRGGKELPCPLQAEMQL